MSLLLQCVVTYYVAALYRHIRAERRVYVSMVRFGTQHRVSNRTESVWVHMCCSVPYKAQLFHLSGSAINRSASHRLQDAAC